MTQDRAPSRVVAERVREVRDRMVPKLSAAGLAERCAALGMPELNRDVIANIESGRRRSVTVDELFVLAAALGVSPGYLLGQSDDVDALEVHLHMEDLGADGAGQLGAMMGALFARALVRAQRDSGGGDLISYRALRDALDAAYQLPHDEEDG